MSDTLRMVWSKRERDFLFHYPAKGDGGMLNDFLLGEKTVYGTTLIEELTARGYDVKTLKVSVKKLKETKR